MDTIGFGESSKPLWVPDIEHYALAVVQFLDALGIRWAFVVGHHTGGVIAIELAASHPDRVSRLVLSSTPYVDDEFRRSRADRPYLDEVELSADGEHLKELWQQRMPFYPPGRPDLLQRFVVDALKAGDHSLLGHKAVAAYHMEESLPHVQCQTLILAAAKDPFAYPHAAVLASKLHGSRIVELSDGMVPLPDQLPEQFARIVLDFLESG